MLRDEGRWKTLFYVYTSMLVYSLCFQVIPPILSFIVAALDISHAQVGALMSFFAFPAIFISIPGGILTDVYGPRRISLIALATVLVGVLLVGLGNRYSMLVAGRIITGIGTGTIAIVAPQTISRWFAKRDLGSAMGLFNTAMPIGTIFAFNVFGRMAAIWNWRIPVICTAGYTFLILLLFYFKHPGLPVETRPRNEKREKPGREKHSLKKMGSAIWLIAVIWMLFNASSISYLTFAGDYFTTAGYDPGYAGFLSSLFMIGSVLFSPLVGYLTDRVKREENFIIGGSIALALLLLLLPRSGLNPLFLGVLVGLAAAFIPAPVFALVPKYIPTGQIGLGYGISSTCLNIGILVGPFLVGLAYDRTLSYLFGFNLMALFVLVLTAVALFLRFRERPSL